MESETMVCDVYEFEGWTVARVALKSVADNDWHEWGDRYKATQPGRLGLLKGICRVELMIEDGGTHAL